MECRLCKTECVIDVDATIFGCDNCTKLKRNEGGYIMPFQNQTISGETTPTHWDCECDENWIHEKRLETHCERCGFSHEECPDSHIIDVYNFKDL